MSIFFEDIRLFIDVYKSHEKVYLCDRLYLPVIYFLMIYFEGANIDSEISQEINLFGYQHKIAV